MKYFYHVYVESEDRQKLVEAKKSHILTFALDIYQGMEYIGGLDTMIDEIETILGKSVEKTAVRELWTQ